MKKVKKSKSIILFTIAFLISLLAILSAFLFWLYNFKPTQTKIAIFQRANLPIGRIQNSFVHFNDFWQYRQAARKFSNEADPILLARFIEKEKNKLVAKKFGINVSGLELEKAKSENQNADKREVPAEFFYNEILVSDILNTKLQIWYNSRQEYHQAEYLKMDSYLKKIKSGENFSLLASTYSQDEGTKMLGGDAGYVVPSNLLEEIQNQIVAMQSGEVKILPSRLGLHLIQLTDKNPFENNVEKWRIYQIFINLNGYEDWLKSETSKIQAKQFIKL